jgi:hypothetical protein
LDAPIFDRPVDDAGKTAMSARTAVSPRDGDIIEADA